jgi:TonB-dependent starch-binding outer membrane protein SusC
MRARYAMLLLAMSLWAGDSPLEAQGRTVRGVVNDSASGTPIAGASILLRGTSINAITGPDGRFTLGSVPEAGAVVIVRKFGYRFRNVTIPSGTTEISVALANDPLQLDEVVVTGAATAVERRNLPNAVATVSGEEVAKVSAQSVEHALQGKIAGAVIQTNGGAPGGGVQVRMRGVTSINAASEPLYVVDGVIMSNVAIPSNQNAVTNAAGGSNPALTQDAQVNRVADINPADIETVEVLKGASASAIYGSRASNGVVLITTKRGGGGRSVRLTQRFGTYQLSNKLGARRFNTLAEAQSVWGAAAATYFQPGVVYDHEEQLAGHSPLSSETLLDLGGGSEATRYRISGAWKDDGGIIKNTGFERQSLRANLDQGFGDRVHLSVGTNIIRTLASRGLTNNDNATVSFHMTLPFTPSFVNLQQNADGTFRPNPFAASNPLQTAALMTNDEIVWRYLGSAQLSYDAWRSERQDLRFMGTFGTDYFAQKNELLFPAELQFEDDDGQPGTSLLSNSDNLNLNTGVNGVHTFTPATGNWKATTSFGTSFATRDLNTSRIVARNLVGGLDIVNAGTNVQVREIRQRVEDFSLFAQEELLMMGERLLLIAGVNADRSSVNSDDKKMYVYPKLAASYRLGTAVPWTDELKLRAAYGVSGNQPLYGQKFTPLVATQNINGLPTLLTGGVVGSDQLAPERQREVEAGFDLTGRNRRGTLEFTYFQKNVSDLLLQRTLAPSTGFGLEIFNGGKLRTTGVEVGLEALPVVSPDWQWLVRTTYFSNRSTITELPVPTFRTGGFGTSLGAFQIEQGKSSTQIVGNDSLPDGSSVVRKIGDANPDFVMSFGSEVTFKRLRLSGLLDWQKGSHVINLTKFLYDLGQNTEDYADPFTRANGTTTTVGAHRLEAWPKETGVYVEDASFVKLREVTLGFDVPDRLSSRLWSAAHTVRLSLSGRNLFTATDYTGLDPEVSNFGNQNIARNIDVAPFPPSRSFWFGVDITF